MADLTHCQVGADAYRRKLRLLLRTGDVWEMPRGGAFDQLLLAMAEEYSRYHAHICQQTGDAQGLISPLPGWSALDYERLLLERFGITAVVTDGLSAFTCESACDAPIFNESIVYAYVITVDDVSTVPESVLEYLREYQQSHTHFYLRDRQLSASTLYDVAAFDCESPCDAPLYERDWHGVELYADATWPTHALNTLPAWAAIASTLRDYTDIYRGTHAPTQ